ncbi:MAG TPA: ribosome biogenesis GTP-binding protein YihA/YsxC [Steroidobacteraceae bacterium]|nr:ribosome biogenesis GTP-binding protein YihA/YsxC [Steroidobacteraceae bacterium]
MSRFSHARFVLSAADPGQFPADVGAEVAFAGRSNAGKSSAINAITHRQGLARTSKTPGRTQLLNFFELAPGERLVDLPGYGYAQVPAAQRRVWPPLLEALRTRASLRGVFVIVDARRGMQVEDAALLGWVAGGQAIHVLLSKADKLNRSDAAAALRAAATALAGRGSVQLFSALKGLGVREAEDTLAGWLAGGR